MDAPRPGNVAIGRWLVGGAGVVALAAMLVDFGWPPGPWRPLLQAVEVAAAFVFAVHLVARLAAAPDRRAHLRRHWLGFALLAGLVLQAAAGALVSGEIVGGPLLAGAQVYLVAQLLGALARANDYLTRKLDRPAWVLVAGFLLLIAVGTFLLLLPLSRAPQARPWSFTDALFTASSAACVTGLGVRDVGVDLSFRGQVVLLALIQVGGLGLVTLTLFITALQERSVRLRHATFLRDFWSARALGDPARFLAQVLAITVVVELAGAALLFVGFRQEGLDPASRAWWAVFHSVSAFCNAGFGFRADSFVGYVDHPTVSLTLSSLIVLGGLGFPVISDLLDRLRWFAGRRRRGLRLSTETAPRLSLHSRLVLRASLVLVVGGGLLFWLSERNHAFSGRSAGECILASLFQSVNARTAGFCTIDPGTLRPLTLLLTMILMVVGASPASTGGGIRTTTAAIFGLTLRAMIRGRERVDLLGRSLPRSIVNAAVSIFCLYCAAAVVVLALLLAVQPNEGFLGLLFETFSALSTVGLSTGVTGRLGEAGRLVVCVAMFVGRVGPLVILWTLVSRPPALRYEYPEEPVVVS